MVPSRGDIRINTCIRNYIDSGKMIELKLRGYSTDKDGVTFYLVPKEDDGTYYSTQIEWSYLKKIIE